MLLALAVMVATGSYFVTRGIAPQIAPPADEGEQAWLQREFKLSPEQAVAVEKMQAAYQPVCAEHCRLIMAAHDRLAAHPDEAAARQEIARLEQICHDATLQHLRDVAAQMSPEQGRRFLALVEPKVSRQQHDGPLGLK